MSCLIAYLYHIIFPFSTHPSVLLCTLRLATYPWSRHQMETFAALLVICARNSPVTGEFPAQSPVTRGLDFSLICAWINGWINNSEAGDLRYHCAHYDVTVMYWVFQFVNFGVSFDYKSVVCWASLKMKIEQFSIAYHVKGLMVCSVGVSILTSFRWLSVRLWYLLSVSNVNTAD